MQPRFRIPLWKTAPIIRLLIPLIAGILLEWKLLFDIASILYCLVLVALLLFLFYFLPLSIQFIWMPVRGILINLLFLVVGALVCWQKDIRHHPSWYGHFYQPQDFVVARILEPLVEKPKSYKSVAMVEALVRQDTVLPCKGQIIISFNKDSLLPPLQYGDQIIFHKPLQGIKNSGNPGAFDYKQYAAFQQNFQQVFLKATDWELLPQKQVNHFQQFIYEARTTIVKTLRTYINADSTVQGIAEALLIGYTNDLDKDLVQAYSNTGVVHIIAISGMHLGLIYVMLSWLFSRTPFIKKSSILQYILIIGFLWIFSLLTGAGASVIRSAVMFSFMLTGKTFFRQSSIYNSLAASAFVMLLYNPFYLWELGFQLSYLAIIGILVFQKPIYHLIYIPYKWLDKIWELAAVSIAAQLLTFPICIYYFHQFPNFFLITNLLAVPLSSIILILEILIMLFAWAPMLPIYLGKLTSMLIQWMNAIVRWLNASEWAVWEGISISWLATVLLYAWLMATAYWLLLQQQKLFKLALFFLLALCLSNAYQQWLIATQERFIGYQIPKQFAIDFIAGNKVYGFSDTADINKPMKNASIEASRIYYQVQKSIQPLPGIYQNKYFFQFGEKRIAIVDKNMQYVKPPQKIPLDYLILTNNPTIDITALAQIFEVKLYIFGAANSLWKIGKWKQECEALHLRFHSIPEDGAFVSDHKFDHP